MQKYLLFKVKKISQVLLWQSKHEITLNCHVWREKPPTNLKTSLVYWCRSSCNSPLVLWSGDQVEDRWGGPNRSLIGPFSPCLFDSGDYRLVCWGCLVAVIAGWLSITAWSIGCEGKKREQRRKDPFNQMWGVGFEFYEWASYLSVNAKEKVLLW